MQYRAPFDQDDFNHEMDILNEQPYKPLKHFIYLLPDLIYETASFTIKLIVAMMLIQTVMASILATALVTIYESEHQEQFKTIINEVLNVK